MKFKILMMSLALAGYSIPCGFAQSNEVASILDGVKSQYAPDTRVAVWTVTSEQKDGIEVVSGEVDSQAAKDAIFKGLREANIKFDDKVSVLPSDTIQKPWAVVNISVACRRKEADNASELITQAIMGTPVRVLKSEDGMSYVQTPNKYLGWVRSRSLQFKTEAEIDAWKKSERIVVTKLESSVYATPKVDNQQIVSDLLLGNILEKKGEKGKFVKVSTPDGRIGYVLKKDVESLDHWAQQKYDFTKIANNARQMMGRPYFWGGMSTKMADCSGFVGTMYFSNGIILPRDASQQALVGKKIKCENWRTDAEPGDLIFIGTKSGKVTHVALYLGDGQFIHSSVLVRVNSMNPEDDNFLDYEYLSMSRINGQIDTNGIASVKNHPWYF